MVLLPADEPVSKLQVNSKQFLYPRHPNNIRLNLLLCNCLQTPSSLASNVFLPTLFSLTLSLVLLEWEARFHNCTNIIQDYRFVC